jgi:hypothetical protein
MLQIGIRAMVFNTEPGWAMLVEIEAKVSERIVVEVDKIQVQSMVSMLSLDGLDKWSLDPRFQEEIVSGGPISNLRTFLSAKKLPWSCYEAQEE